MSITVMDIAALWRAARCMTHMPEQDLYRSEAAYYSRLFDEGQLLQEFVPSPSRDGSVIRIYELKRD